jgi:hypothetical protein
MSLVKKDDYSSCWMCGDLADTTEHKIKCSQLKLTFPNISLKVGDRLIKTNSDGNEDDIVQGWNSNKVKYDKKNLCEKCNSDTSQPWDKAYDDFASFIRENPKLVYKNRVVNLKLVYGKEVKSCQADLFRYFAKAFGCSIYEKYHEVPTAILDVISGKNYRRNFFITISVIEEIYDYNSAIKDLIGCSDLISIDHGNIPIAWRWSQNLAWFVIDFRFNLVVPKGFKPWTGKSKKILFSPSIKLT